MTGGTLRLYNFFTSSCSFRVRIALAYKGLEYDYVSVNLTKRENKEPWYGKVNPMGQVPALELSGGVVLCQSQAIMEYLEEQFPEKGLIPPGGVERAEVRGLCELVASGIQPVQNLGVLREISRRYGKEHVGDWAQHWINNGFSALEQTLSHTAGSYSYGDTLTLADCCLLPQVYNATEKYGVSLDPYPTLKKVAQNGFAHPAVIAAHPSNQPDTPPSQ